MDQQPQLKKISTPLAVGVLVLLAIFGGVLYVRNGQIGMPAISDQSTASSVPADWKTYTNLKYGFEFKYPPRFSNFEEYPDQGKQECQQTDVGKGVRMNFIAVANGSLQVNVVCQALQRPQATTFETDFSATSVTQNNQENTLRVAGNQSNEVEFTTATGYSWKIAQIPLDGSHYVEIGHTFGNSNYLNGEKDLIEEEWGKILSSFRFSSGTTSAEAASKRVLSVEEQKLIGLWQDAPHVASAYGATYSFYPSGKYAYRVSQYEPHAGHAGYWKIENGKLVLMILERSSTVGGTVAPNTLSGGTVNHGGTYMTNAIPGGERKGISIVEQCANVDPSDNDYPCIKLDGVKWWRLFDKVGGTEFPEPTFAAPQAATVPAIVGKCGLSITSPTPNTRVSFPLVIKGMVDNSNSKTLGCSWSMFEGQAGTVQLSYLDKGVWHPLGVSVPVKVDDWTSTKINFAITLNFNNDGIGLVPGTELKVVFMGENPSGLAANNKTFELPFILGPYGATACTGTEDVLGAGVEHHYEGKIHTGMSVSATLSCGLDTLTLSGSINQVITSADISPGREGLLQEAKDGYDPVTFKDDYNFDGYNDLATLESYGSEVRAYNIFLFDPVKKVFVYNKELSAIGDYALTVNYQKQEIVSTSLIRKTNTTCDRTYKYINGHLQKISEAGGACTQYQ